MTSSAPSLAYPDAYVSGIGGDPVGAGLDALAAADPDAAAVSCAGVTSP